MDSAPRSDFDVIVIGAGPGRKVLSGKSPIPGFFFVGCDAGGFGLGTHQAVDSAMKAAEFIISFRNKP